MNEEFLSQMEKNLNEMSDRLCKQIEELRALYSAVKTHSRDEIELICLSVVLQVQGVSLPPPGPRRDALVQHWREVIKGFSPDLPDETRH